MRIGSPEMVDKEERVGGFDKYEVQRWLDELIATQEVLSDKKKVAAVRTLMTTKAKAVDKAEELLGKTNDRLKKTFGGK